MIRDVVPLTQVWRRIRSPWHSSLLASCAHFVERVFNIPLTFNTATIPFRRVDLADILLIIEKLRARGVVHSVNPVSGMTDEPQLRQWYVKFRDTASESTAGGSSITDDHLALTKATAEAVERHIWFERDDYFTSMHTASFAQILQKGHAISPERFAGISPSIRGSRPHLHLSPEREYLWIRGISLLDSKPVWIPAQIVSAHRSVRERIHAKHEPTIRSSVTTGLATHPDRTEALLSGLLEIIERDAYMIMWLNQLSLPRIPIDELCSRSPHLTQLVESCTRYRLRVTFVRMISDAPTYAICAIVEDETAHQPAITFGAKAHRNAHEAAEGALMEALRARRTTRIRRKPGAPTPGPKDVGHEDRLLYWTYDNRAERLRIFCAGPFQPLTHEVWDTDTHTQHLERILSWCTERGYACVTVPFSRSKANATPWHIEMTVIPELQPIYFNESLPHIASARITEIPQRFGYTPRPAPYTDEPHPYS